MRDENIAAVAGYNTTPRSRVAPRSSLKLPVVLGYTDWNDSLSIGMPLGVPNERSGRPFLSHRRAGCSLPYVRGKLDAAGRASEGDLGRPAGCPAHRSQDH